MKVDEPGRSGIAHVAEDLSGLEPDTDRPTQQSRTGRIEVGIQHDVVVQHARLADHVSRDDRRPEELSYVDHLGVLLLMLEGYDHDRRSTRGPEVDPSVAHVSQMPATALQLVCTVKVVAAEDAGRRARDGISIRVVVCRAIGAARDLVVDHPVATRIAVGCDCALGGRCALVVIRKVDADSVVGELVGRALGPADQERGARSPAWAGQGWTGRGSHARGSCAEAAEGDDHHGVRQSSRHA
jgi:hypothetical protein